VQIIASNILYSEACRSISTQCWRTYVLNCLRCCLHRLLMTLPSWIAMTTWTHTNSAIFLLLFCSLFHDAISSLAHVPFESLRQRFGTHSCQYSWFSITPYFSSAFHNQASCQSLKVLEFFLSFRALKVLESVNEGPRQCLYFFILIFQPLKVLENRHSPWKSLN